MTELMKPRLHIYIVPQDEILFNVPEKGGTMETNVRPMLQPDVARQAPQ